MSGPEQRREMRRKANGRVHVEFSDPHPVQIEGRLMDLSASGFRMAHGCASLAAGQIVEYSHVESSGIARVIWNRILAERVETGFVVIKR